MSVAGMEKSRGLLRRPFYGWWIVLVAFLADFIMSGTGFYAFSVLIRAMREELGWSLAVLTGVLIVRSAVTGLLSPVLGPLVDRRHGARMVMALGGLVGGLGTMSIALVQTPLQFYLAYGVVGAASMATSSMLVSTTVVAKWFVRQRGRAIAIATMGISLGGMVMIPLATLLMQAVGWRLTWAVLGALGIALVVPPSAILVRRQPEDLGLAPDGLPTPPKGRAPGAERGEVFWTLREALGTRALWLLVLAFNLAFLGLNGTLLHQINYLRTRGLTPGQAALAASLLSFLAFATKPLWGLLAERVHIRKVVVVAFLGCAGGTAVLLQASSLPPALLYALVFGTFVAGVAPFQAVVFANYYGRQFLGAIRGVVMPASTVATSAAPLLVSLVVDRTGSYYPALVSLMGAWLLGAVCMLGATQPRKRPPSR